MVHPIKAVFASCVFSRFFDIELSADSSASNQAASASNAQQMPNKSGFPPSPFTLQIHHIKSIALTGLEAFSYTVIKHFPTFIKHNFQIRFIDIMRSSENLPLHFSDDLLLVQLKNLVITNKVLNLSYPTR